MSAVESPSAFPESPLDETDAVYPCKGCGEILEEGKAFELAGNRWHIDCFRCNTCGTLLDSDANLLLLGDGSLICNNCTYSCNACGNKIEDLAILTGDQAFCAACFRCRNCKRKIENLRYARTSQGIFCMSCHESLMARRRKKAKASRQASNGSAPIVLDKSLPALPPNAIPHSVLEDDMLDDEADDTPIESRSPNSDDSSTHLHMDSIATGMHRDVSPMSDDRKKDTLTLPASTYVDERQSSVSSMAHSDEDDRGFLPMAFDPTPAPPPMAAPGLPPMAKRRMERRMEAVTPTLTENAPPKDYFTGRPPSKSAHRDTLRDTTTPPARSESTERDGSSSVIKKPLSPHIAFQEKGRLSGKNRESSGTNTPASGSAVASPAITQAPEKLERPRPPHLNSQSFTLGNGDGFKLQEVPKSKKASTRSNRNSDQRSPDLESRMAQPRESARSTSTASLETSSSGINPFDDPKLRDHQHVFRHPARGDSLTPSAPARKPVPTSFDATRSSPPESTTPTLPGQSPHTRNVSTASIPASFADAQSHPPNSARSFPRSLDSPMGNNMEIPARAATRPSAPSKSVANDDFIAPRMPPPPPSADRDRRNESVSSLQNELLPNDGQRSPVVRGHLAKNSLGQPFKMDEEFSRILLQSESRKREPGESSPSVLRRVSNAVRHGRSFSDRAVPASQRTPTMDTMDVSSPISSPSTEDLASLKSHLRRAQQKIAELESEKVGLEEQVNSSVDIKQVNTELREKRSTMAVLDTQREMVVRELEIMTEHLTKAKETTQPFDVSVLTTGVMQDFARSLHKLKDSLGSQIEDLVQKRNELTDEISNLIQVKDKGLQEFESLSTKNQQLNEHNARLVNDIQDTYKSRADGTSGDATNALRIGHPYSAEARSLDSTHRMPESMNSQNHLVQESVAAESFQMVNAPQVVDIRKGQPKRFNWKRGGRDVAKNVTKGLKGAFAKDGQYEGNGVAYASLQAGSGAAYLHENGMSKDRQGSEAGRGAGGLGFFGSGATKNGLKPGVGNTLKNLSSPNLAIEPTTLFGSDLGARCDYERHIIPAVVTRCVEEVEARGMDIEGVYRKSGGSGLVKSIQQGFEKDSAFDISDPDLDIHAVTSTLKQYFRKLPNPLITFDIYDSVLDASQMSDPEKKVNAMKAAIAGLPQSHRDVLEYLVHHLARVVEQEKENLMTPLNLSVVFAPTIMRPVSIEREMTDMQAQRDVVRTLLDNPTTVFD